MNTTTERKKININSIGKLSSIITLNNQKPFEFHDIKSLIDEIINLNIKMSEVKTDVDQLIIQKVELQTQIKLLEDTIINLEKKINDLENRTIIEVVANKIDTYLKN